MRDINFTLSTQGMHEITLNRIILILAVYKLIDIFIKYEWKNEW